MEIFETSTVFKCLEGFMKNREEALRRYRIEHGADVIVTRDPRHLEQRLAVGTAAPATLLQPALVRQKRRALHKEDSERRHADIGHGVARILALAHV